MKDDDQPPGSTRLGSALRRPSRPRRPIPRRGRRSRRRVPFGPVLPASDGRTGSPAPGRSRARASTRAGRRTRSPRRPRRSPSACARLTRFAVIAASLASCSTPWTNERSTLIMSTGKRRSCAERREAGAEVVDRDAHAVVVQLLELGSRPVAARRPPRRSRSRSPRGRDSSGGQARRRASAARTSVARPRRGELLARQVHPGDEAARAAGRRAASARSARRPRAARTRRAARISPVASATGMNRSGGHLPARRRVPAQRAPRRPRSCRCSRSTSGW